MILIIIILRRVSCYSSFIIKFTFTHLGIKDRTRPGIRLDMKKNKTLLKKLPDQFKPFENVFGCKVRAFPRFISLLLLSFQIGIVTYPILSNVGNVLLQVDPNGDCNYDGTLFRFPLRTQEQASKSDISQCHYDKSQMLDLLALFAKGIVNSFHL